MSYNPVTIACTDGRRYTESVARTRSHWDYPLTREEWVGMFKHLEDVADVRQVGKLLGRS